MTFICKSAGDLPQSAKFNRDSAQPVKTFFPAQTCFGFEQAPRAKTKFLCVTCVCYKDCADYVYLVLKKMSVFQRAVVVLWCAVERDRTPAFPVSLILATAEVCYMYYNIHAYLSLEFLQFLISTICS